MDGFIKLSSPATSQFWKVPVLWEDDCLLAVNKPAGLLASPDRYDRERPNLMKLLHHGIERGAGWAKDRGLTYLMNAHRLDFGTSGVFLLAKNKPSLVALADQFGAAKPHKIYVTLARGAPSSDHFETDAPLAPHLLRVGEMRVDAKGGKLSKTEFSVRERYPSAGCVLLECRPLTGRTHQIRIHLKHLRLPIIADSIYGGSSLLLSSLKPDYRLKPGQQERPLISDVALHAEQLSVTHPVTKAEVKITAAWPKDMTVAVKYLRQYGRS